MNSVDKQNYLEMPFSDTAPQFLQKRTPLYISLISVCFQMLVVLEAQRKLPKIIR